MTVYPRYLSHYPNADTTFPFHIRSERNKGMRISAHRHDFLELALFVKGQATEIINGAARRIEGAELTLLLPYQIHELVYAAGIASEIYICNFDMELLYSPNEADWGFQALLDGQSDQQRSYVELNAEQLAQVQALFDAMLHEHRQDGPWSKLMIKAKLTEALVLFDRFRKETQQPSLPAEQANNAEQAPGVPDLKSKSIWPAVHYVHQHYREPISLQELAQRFHFHASYLSEQFKQQVGSNFVHFLQELRIRHACSLLLSSDLPVSAIGMEVGFGSFQSFSRNFRKFKGMTPAEFRRTRAQ